jgi:cytochrome P450 family 135
VVLVSHPDDVRRVFTAPASAFGAAGSGSILEPFAGPYSILVLDGDEHLAQRKRMLPPFHGDRMRAYRATIEELTRDELRSWSGVVDTHARMQDLTLEVMLRVVFGSDEPRLRAAIVDALGLTRSAPLLVAMALGLRGPFERRVAEFDAVVYDVIERADGGLLGELKAVSSSAQEVRDQLVTLLAAGHETTATGLAWAFERLSRHPQVVARLDEPAYRAATVKEILRVRPVLSIAPRTLAEPFEVAGTTLPAGVQLAPCIYLTHRRADVWGDPLAFRPARFLADDVPPYAWIPFGGGIRRCLGAAFAQMEMDVVLAEAARLGHFEPVGRPERVRRRAVTLAPAHGGRIRWTS